MKIIITGSVGNISRPLTEQLVQKGHSVVVISSDINKLPVIEALGATAAIGSLKDPDFLKTTFTGADAIYCMIPLSFTEQDLAGYFRIVSHNYVQAIKYANIKNVVLLSGWAADFIPEENVENVFDELTNVSVTILRPAVFYSNFYMSVDLIRGKGLIGKYLTFRHFGLMALLKGKTGLLMGNYGGEDRIVFVSPKDIANAAAEELLTTTTTTKIRYVGSEEMTCNEAAKIIGTAIGKPYLKWVLLSDRQMLQGLKMAKLPDGLAQTLVKMQAAMHSGNPLQNFKKANPVMGKVKLEDFAQEFAAAYNQNQ